MVADSSNFRRLVIDLEAVAVRHGEHANAFTNIPPVDPSIIQALFWQHTNTLFEDVSTHGFTDLGGHSFKRKMASTGLRAMCMFQKNHGGGLSFDRRSALQNCNDLELHHAGRKRKDYDDMTRDGTLRENLEEVINGKQYALPKGEHEQITAFFEKRKKRIKVDFTRAQEECVGLRTCLEHQ